MRRPFLSVVSTAMLLALGAVPAAATQTGTSVASHAPISVKTSPTGTLSPDRFTATVQLRVRCSPGFGDVFEALTTVNQPQTFGQGFFGPVCDGRWHRATAVVPSFDAPFVPGRAFVSSYVLICNEAGACVTGQDGRNVELR